MAVRVNYQEGDKIGELTFINREGSQSGSPMAKFRCDCGKEFITRIESAKNGASKSCGCKAKELAKLKKKRYEAGHKFGEIVLLNRIEGSNPQKARGLFLCYCGVEFETNITSIATGHAKSCGCYYIKSRTEPRNIYEIGQQIGTCFYMGDADYKSGFPRRATFRCHCGNYFITQINSLENGTTKSCGCQTIELLRAAGNAPIKPMPNLSKSDVNRFWDLVEVKDSKDECWNWKLSSERYGHFSHKSRQYKSNRMAYFISTGQDPKEMEVMHSCDNPKCCNPNHLSLGTHWENMQDMAEKGRAFNGKEFKMYKDY